MMHACTMNYELVDFGDGGRLERFGNVRLDRPCPAADGTKTTRRELWAEAAARFDGRTGEGQWKPQRGKWEPENWRYEFEGEVEFRLGLNASPSGQIGV